MCYYSGNANSKERKKNENYYAEHNVLPLYFLTWLIGLD